MRGNYKITVKLEGTPGQSYNVRNSWINSKEMLCLVLVDGRELVFRNWLSFMIED